MSFFSAPAPLSVADLRELLSCGWIQQSLSEATADDVDENGWVTLSPAPSGSLSVRLNHPSYPDGVVWVDEHQGAHNIWTFLLKRTRLGRPMVQAFWQSDFAGDRLAVEPDDAARHTLLRQRAAHLMEGVRSMERRRQATLAWTQELERMAQAEHKPWSGWWRQCRDMQALAERRGWRVTPLRAAPPASEADLQAVEQAHGVRIPAQLRQLFGMVAADVHFGWRCSRDDEPEGAIASLYGGGIRQTLWSLEMVHRYALANYNSWRDHYHGDEAPRHETECPNPAALWANQFAFAHLANGDALTIDTTNPDPVDQPVRYFSHEAEGMHGEALAPNLYAFFDAWCALGCAGSEQHQWDGLRDAPSGFLSAHGKLARRWSDWLNKDPNQREPDEAPRPVLARSAADQAWLDAARHQDLVAMQAALDQGARIDCSPDDWRDEDCTAVIWAVKNDSLPTLEWLLERGASLSTKQLSTAVAVCHASPSTLQWLIAHGARLDRWREQRFCPLHELMSSNRSVEDYQALMDLLLQGGADPDAFWDLNSSGARTTALMRAGPWTTQRLLASGADPQVRDLLGCTALHHARHPQVIDRLVDAGLDPNDLSTPDGDEPGLTPLQFALHNEWAEAVAPALLAVGADPWRSDGLGRHAWFHCFDAFCVDRLLALGFDVNAQDATGKTVLHHLLAHTQRLYGRYLETAQRLIERGLDLGLADEKGDTALHVMAHCYDSVHDRPSLEFLLKHGADPTRRNLKGQQAWQCVGRRHKAAAALLRPSAI